LVRVSIVIRRTLYSTLGQQLWFKELESYAKYPPLQAPETYNLSQVIQEVKKMHNNNVSD
jgi:hypothetical protein